MGFTPEQIKGRIKSVAKQNNADAKDTHANLYDGAFSGKDWHNQNIGITSLSKAEY